MPNLVQHLTISMNYRTLKQGWQNSNCDTVSWEEGKVGGCLLNIWRKREFLKAWAFEMIKKGGRWDAELRLSLSEMQQEIYSYPQHERTRWQKGKVSKMWREKTGTTHYPLPGQDFQKELVRLRSKIQMSKFMVRQAFGWDLGLSVRLSLRRSLGPRAHHDVILQHIQDTILSLSKDDI